jgi:hypothetical protein
MPQSPLRDLIDRIDVIYALGSLRVTMVHGVDPPITRSPVGVGSTALADGHHARHWKRLFFDKDREKCDNPEGFPSSRSERLFDCLDGTTRGCALAASRSGSHGKWRRHLSGRIFDTWSCQPAAGYTYSSPQKWGAKEPFTGVPRSVDLQSYISRPCTGTLPNKCEKTIGTRGRGYSMKVQRTSPTPRDSTTQTGSTPELLQQIRLQAL